MLGMKLFVRYVSATFIMPHFITLHVLAEYNTSVMLKQFTPKAFML